MLIFGIKLIFKGGLISEVYHFGSNFEKIGAKSNKFPELRWIVLRGVIWHPFGGI
jgi:hypothetical protein